MTLMNLILTTAECAIKLLAEKLENYWAPVDQCFVSFFEIFFPVKFYTEVIMKKSQTFSAGIVEI